MLKRMIVLLLSVALLLGLIPTALAESKPETRATAFVGYPSVFVEEDRYRISFQTNTNGMAWVEIGGVAYEDTTTGIMDWETKLHGIPVPQSVLNAAKSYTICFQPLSERPANNPAPGTKQTKTYSFNPVLPGEDPVLLCVSDQHDNNTGAVNVSKYGAFDALVFGGDYTAHISTEAIANNFLTYAGNISKGTKPVIYPRGNHEIRGQYTHWIDGVMPTSSTNKSYYEVILGDVYGIVLDCGGSYTDNYDDIADTIDFEPYRVEQTRWLEQVYAKGTWKQYSKRVIFSHVPFITQANFTDIFTDWTNILNRMDMSLLVSGHTHNFTMYGTTHSSIKTGSNFPAFTMTAYTKDPYVYTGAYLTLGDGEFTIQQVDSASLAVKSTHKVTNKTNGIATEPVTTFVTAEAPLRAPTVAAGTGSGSIPAVSSPFSAHPTVFMVEDKYEISFLTTGTGMAWVEIGGVKYKDSTMGVMDWESRIHKITVPQSVLNRAKSYKICFQSMTERKAYTPVHGSTVSRTYPFTPAPDVPTFLFMSDQLNDNTNAMKVSTYKEWDVFVCGGKYMKAANTENNRYYLLTLCGETTQGTKPTIFARGNREVRGFGAHDVVDSMGTSSTGKSYYYFTTETVFGIVLDTGEFGADSVASYGGTVRFQKYREEQAKWLRQILAEGKWKDYKTRIVICHQPFTTKVDSTMSAVFKEWTQILNEMGVTLMIAGHENQYAYYAPNNAANLTSPNFPMLTMSDSGNGDYVYSGTYITFKGKTFYTENVQHTLKVRERKTVTNPLFTEGADLISNYDPTHDQNVLYFGFSNTPEDQQRYSENPVYGGTNYDEDGNLRTTNFVKGGGVNFDVPYSPNQAFNREAGIVKAMVTGPYPTQSSYTGCVSRRFVFGETNDTIASVGSLKYNPANAEVVQVRFMLENLKLRSDIDTVDPNARARNVSLQYYKNDATSATRNGYNYGGTHVNGKYVTVTLNLDNNFRSADVITKIWIEFHGFVKQNDSADAYVYLDYVYIGPRATMPTRDDGYLFFDFTDSAASQYRYASEVYGGTNFDRIRNWWDNGDVAYKTVVNGNLRYISKAMNAKSWHYLGTGVGDDDSSKREYPLHYKPAADDYCEVRLALKGATSNRADGKIGLQLELFPSVGTTDNSVKVVGYFDAKLAEDGYCVVHFPVGRNASYLAMAEIVRMNVQLVNLGYGDVITVDTDYIYIGSEENMPTAHTYETVQTPPTCTENGSITYQCKICGKGNSEVLPATGHTVVKDNAVAATCTTAGKTEGSHCSVCNAVIEAQTDVPATGHNYTSKVTTAATCTKDGVKTFTCSKCNHSYTEAISATGHTEVVDKAVAATCTTAGKTEGSHCSVCNAVIKAQTTIPATGHSYTSKVTTAATCTKDGVKTFTCSKCNHSYTEAISATGHTEVIDKAVAATCTTAGKTEGSHCSVCNAVIKAQTTVPATGHSYTSKVTTAATCTTAGVKTFTCSKCNHSYTESIAATGHTEVVDKAVAATCTTAGKTEGSHCSVCNEVITAQTVVPAMGHSYGYTSNGDGTHVVSCARCNDNYAEKHNFANGDCVCGDKELTLDENIQILHTLNLASDIAITFAVPKTALESYDSYYLECEIPKYEGNTLVGSTTVQVQPVATGGYYYFTLTGITAVQMNDMVDAVLHMTKGEQEYISKTDSYSVATYAYNTLNGNANAKMMTLCADLLRYGAEAQSYKKYRTDALVDADMTATHRSYLSSTTSLTFSETDSYLSDLENPTITWVGKTLDLGSKVGIKFVFDTKNYSGNISKLSMKVTYMNSQGETTTVTLTGAEAYGSTGSYYSFTFYGLLASELRTAIDVAVYEGETRLSETLRYSAETYASKTIGNALEPLTRALFAYSDSAKAYFTK